MRVAKEYIDTGGKTILVTGSPGFIGANLVLRLLGEMPSGKVLSFDNMNAYYDPALKAYRLSLIEEASKRSGAEHIFIKGDLSNKAFKLIIRILWSILQHRQASAAASPIRMRISLPIWSVFIIFWKPAGILMTRAEKV